MGRRGTWAKLTRRPSDYFKDHCVAAPFAEENLTRVIGMVGPGTYSPARPASRSWVRARSRSSPEGMAMNSVMPTESRWRS
jgi:hypothetical protein